MASRRPYSVLLPVGFAMPPPLPSARCALTAPFHPYHGQLNAPRRYVFCGTVPGLAPAGCYPAPLVRGARTFLSGNLSVSPERPSDRLTLQAWGYQGSPSRAAARRLRHKLKESGCGAQHRGPHPRRNRPGAATAGKKLLQCTSRRLIGMAIDAFGAEVALKGGHDF
jgi:hypothetical protein